MLLRLKRPLVFFDLETTGLDVENDRIVEIGMIRIEPDGTRRSYEHRVDPGIDIPESATKIHGIKTEDVRGLFGQPRLEKLGPQLLEFLGDADLGGFNAILYDQPLLLAEFRRHGIAFELGDRKTVDPKLIFDAREANWDRFLMGPRNLSAALRHYCGRELVGAHGAVADIEATVDVLMAQLERYEDLPRDVAGLHTFCQRQAEERERARAARQQTV